MAVFLVERYAPRPELDVALDEMEAGPAERGDVRLVLSVTVPGDEIALSLFEARTAQEVVRVLEAGGIRYIRIVEALVRGAADRRGARGSSDRLPRHHRPHVLRSREG